MTEAELLQLLAAITPPDEAARAAAHAHWASLAKPLGGLGALETLLEDAAALTGTAAFDFSRRVVAVLCADNGVVAQGVSQTDQSVTRAVAENLAARRTSVCRMAQALRCAAGRHGHSRCAGARGAGLPHCSRDCGFYKRPGHDPCRGSGGHWPGHYADPAACR